MLAVTGVNRPSAATLGPRATVAGKTLAEQLEACATCHGTSGNSEFERISSLAGQPEPFLSTS